MNSETRDPPRWSQRGFAPLPSPSPSPSPSEDESRAAALFRAAQSAPMVAPVAFERLLPALGGLRQHRTLLVWRAVAVGGVLAAVAGAAAAAVAVGSLRRATSEITLVRGGQATTRVVLGAGAHARIELPAEVPAPVVTSVVGRVDVSEPPQAWAAALPTASSHDAATPSLRGAPALPAPPRSAASGPSGASAAVTSRRRPAVRSVGQAAPPEPLLAKRTPATASESIVLDPKEGPAVAATSTREGRESTLVASALRALRVDRDPARSLVLLDEHAREFPRGALVTEAKLARVEALLALDRSDEALNAIERMSAGETPLGPELRVIQGELRAQRRRCVQAVRDFGAIIARGAEDDLIQRALWGRAACRANLGQHDDAQQDLRRLLERFPDGRFAARARQLLGDEPDSP